MPSLNWTIEDLVHIAKEGSTLEGSTLLSAIEIGRQVRVRARGISEDPAPMLPSEGRHFWNHELAYRTKHGWDSVVLVTGEVGSGKPLALGQGVLMFDGSVKKVEDVAVGDMVMGPESQPRNVISTSRGYGPLMRVVPNKSKPFTVGAEHPLTTVRGARVVSLGTSPRSKRGRSDRAWSRGWRRPRVTEAHPNTASYSALSLGGWIRDRPAACYAGRLRSGDLLLHSEALVFPPLARPLPLDPYLLGVILGDGTLAASAGGRGSITTMDPEIMDYCRRWASEHEMLVTLGSKRGTPAVTVGFVHPFQRMTAEERLRRGRESGRRHYRKLRPLAVGPKPRKDTPPPPSGLARNGRRLNALKESLVRLGLSPIQCHERFIPHEYKVASAAERMEVLAGLIDTDGYITPRGGVDFVSKSQRLADDFSFVSHSLGFRVITRTVEKHDQNGHGGTYHSVSLVGDTDRIPLRVTRKKERLRKHNSFKEPLMEGFRVEPAGEGEHACILVDGDHRFLMDNFLFTHNSTVALRMSQEMDPTFTVENRLCYTSPELLDIYKTILPGQAVLFDEGVRGLLAGDQSSKEQKALIQSLALIREKGAVLFICAPSIWNIAKQVRQNRAYLWIHVQSRGVARVHERVGRLFYQQSPDLGFEISRVCPFLMWKKYPPQSKFFREYQRVKTLHLDDYLEETSDLMRSIHSKGRKKASSPSAPSLETGRSASDEDIFRVLKEGGSYGDVIRKFHVNSRRIVAIKKKYGLG